MGSLHGPKAKAMRRFGQVLVPRAKYQKILERRGFPPGQHGRDKEFRGSRRRSDYGIQLDEKQKLAFVYNIREAQLRRYYLKAARMPGETGPEMLKLLERRLDNLVYKAGFAPTIWAARQLVVHGHVLINGAMVDRPSYSVRVGEMIGIKPKMQRSAQMEIWRQGAMAAPQYLTVDRDKYEAVFSYLPERAEIQTPVNEQLVVEFYNRRT